MMHALRSKQSTTFVWIIVALLIVGLAGFGTGGAGGGGGDPVVAQVGETKVHASIFARATDAEAQQMRRQIGQDLPMEQLQALGLGDRVLGRLMSDAALEESARLLGLSRGDAAVREQLIGSGGFTGPDGAFSPETYKRALERARLDPEDFEETLRVDATRGLLRASVQGGVSMPQLAAELVMQFQDEERAVSWMRFGADALDSPVETPDAAALAGYHAAHENIYTLPEQRKVRFAYATADLLAPSIEVPEDELRRLYEDRSEEFNTPAQLLLERIVYPDAAAAAAARAAIDAGESDFDAAASARGLSLEDTDLGIVAADDLNKTEAEALFGAAEPGIYGPLDSPFGPALYRLNARLDATSVAFDEVRADLTRELALGLAEDRIADMAAPVEVLIAGGASLDDIAAETAMELGEMTLDATSREGLAGDEAFREEVFAAGAGEERDLRDLDDGIFVVRVEEVIAPRLQTLEEVRADVQAAVEAEATAAALDRLGQSLAARLDEGDPAEEIAAEMGVALQHSGPFGRDGIVEDTPPAFVSALFETPRGKGFAVADADSVLVGQVTDVIVPDPQDPDRAGNIALLRTRLSASAAQDMLVYYTVAQQDSAGVQVQRALADQILMQLSGR